MYKKSLDCVRSCFSGAKAKLHYWNAFAIVAVAALSSGSVFAQDPPATTISLGSNGLDWTGAATSVLDKLFGAIAPIVGIAITFWIVSAALHFFKKEAKP